MKSSLWKVSNFAFKSIWKEVFIVGPHSQRQQWSTLRVTEALTGEGLQWLKVPANSSFWQLVAKLQNQCQISVVWKNNNLYNLQKVEPIQVWTNLGLSIFFCLVPGSPFFGNLPHGSRFPDSWCSLMEFINIAVREYSLPALVQPCCLYAYWWEEDKISTQFCQRFFSWRIIYCNTLETLISPLLWMAI